MAPESRSNESSLTMAPPASPAKPGVRLSLLDPRSGAYRWLVLGTVLIATFMAVLDATIVNVALAKLMATFGVTVDRVEWILTAYLLIFGVMLASSGWLADRWGYKRIFILGLFLFTLGSLLCSLAWNIEALIAFRVVQGTGAGCLMPVGMAIITREFPPEKRGIALGFWSVAASASVSLGPTLGGYLIDQFAWNAIFDVNVPVGILGIVTAFVVLREHRPAPRGFFDIVGFLSLSAGLTGLLLALSNGNSAWNTGGWTSDFIVICFGISAVAFLVFLAAEFTVQYPLVQISLFRNFNFSVSILVLFIFGVGMFGANFLVPIYLQDSLGYTPFQTGLMFLPVGLLVGVTAPFAGMFTDRFDGRIPIFVGLALLALTFYQFSSLSVFSEKQDILIPLYVRGVAMGLLMSPLTTMAISEIPNSRMAQASGLINVIRQIGGTFGVAIFGTVLTRRTIHHAAVYGEQIDPYSEVFRRTLAGLQHFVQSTVGGAMDGAVPRARALVVSFVQQQAFVEAMDDVFRIALFIIASALIPCLFLRPHRARGRPGGSRKR